MSNFTLKLNPLSGVESVHIKKGVKWTVIGLGVLVTIIVIGVIMQKGQRNKDKASAPTPTQINTSMTTKQAALDSVLAQKPDTPAPKAVVPTPIPTGNVTPSMPTVTPEMAAQQKQRIAQLEAKQKLLNEAIYSGMNCASMRHRYVRHPAQSNRTVMNYGMRSNASLKPKRH